MGQGAAPSRGAPPFLSSGGRTVSALLEKPALQKGENTPYSSSPFSKRMELSFLFACSLAVAGFPAMFSWLWQVQWLFVLTVMRQNL